MGTNGCLTMISLPLNAIIEIFSEIAFTLKHHQKDLLFTFLSLINFAFYVNLIEIDATFFMLTAGISITNESLSEPTINQTIEKLMLLSDEYRFH